MNEGLVVIIGSGELGPSMRTTYRHLFEHVGGSSITIIDTSFGFQENADDLTARIETHFREGFGLGTKVATLRRPDADDEERTRFLDTIAGSNLVFAGPGSPTYALRSWVGLDLAEALAQVVDRGGAVVMASAAAVTVGTKSIPVYEIYKVGDEPTWVGGLDLLSRYGLNVAVVPHWNNQEGGFHDTSHCFIGARRFRSLVEQLPPETSILGVDEHTSVSLHATSGTMRVLGAGEAHFNEIDFDTSLPIPGFASRPPLPPLPTPEARPSPWTSVVDLMVKMRWDARQRGDFETSDEIRSRLEKAGVEVRDTPDGTEWEII